jgi:chemotaxis protein methyltransferase CheR
MLIRTYSEELNARKVQHLEQTAGAPPLLDYEFRLLRDHIHQYCGIFYDDAKSSTLASRLSFRLKLLGIGSYSEYYNYLKFNPRSDEEIEDLIPHLTNNETYFFREMNQVSFLIDELAKKLKGGKHGKNPLKILSCGCSSGEEAFTLAMLLEEAGAYSAGHNIEITGIDIDRKVIEKAVKGEYTSYSLRAAEKERIDRFFKRDGDKYLLDRSVRDRVTFRRGNLLDPATFNAFRDVDAILCRNVFIYFSDVAIRSIAGSFHGIISGTGQLLLGHSESLSRITDIFKPIRNPNVIVYTKKDF